MFTEATTLPWRSGTTYAVVEPTVVERRSPMASRRL